MKRAIGRTLVASCALLLASAAFGEEEDDKGWLPGGLSGNVAVATDYSFRGISQTQRDMALQGGMDWTHDSGIHLGIWASSIKFRGDKSYLEQDFYGGFTQTYGGFTYDILGVYYFYPMADKYNYGEGILNLSYDFEVAKVMLQGLGSNDYFGYASVGGYINGGVNVPIPLGIDYFDLNFETRVGYTKANQDIYFDTKTVDGAEVTDGDEDYIDQTVALIFTLPFNLTMDFRYVGTDIATHEYGNADAGDRFVFTAKYAF